MVEIFINQSALRFEAQVNVDITGATVTQINYKKPSGSTGSFPATIEDSEAGIMYYDVIDTDELDESGTWILQAFVAFADARSAVGLPIKVVIHAKDLII
jgi:hypothetical protein